MANRVVSSLVALALLGAPAAWSAGSGPAPQAAASQAPAAPPGLAYTVDVRLVEVDVSVIDSAGRPVLDLTREDFQVLEDGQAQRIDTFTLVDLPVEQAEPASSSMPPAESDVHTNVQRAEGRLYVLLLDDLHTAAGRTALVRAAARRFVERNLGPGDLAAVIHLGAGSQAGQEFTADQRRLLASIDRFAGRKSGSETLDKTEDYNRQLLLTGRTPTRITDAEAPSRGDAARVVLDTITEVSRALAPTTGRRKALIWFGEGVNYDLLQGVNVPGRAHTAFGAAARANLAIYGIDARGLRGLGDELVQLGSSPVDPGEGLGAAGLAGELRREQENLRLVSNATGGFAVVNAGDFEGAFERVVQDNSTYYLLGYHSTNEKRDGAFRRIEVRVNRPGVESRARKGYVASAATTPGQEEGAVSTATSAVLRELLASPLPQRSLPLAAQAVAFRGEGAGGSVLVTIQFGAEGFRSAAPPPADDRLELRIAAIDAGGKVQGGDELSIGLQVRPETREAMSTHGFRTIERLELPPGRYQLRIASVVSGTGKIGSVSCDLDVPDFSASSLAMSGLLLTSTMTALTPTAGEDQRLRGVLPAPPTTVRAFRNDDTITVLAEVYDKVTSAPHGLDLLTTVRSGDGRLVFEQADRRTGGELARSGGAHAQTAEIPLADFAPGVYVVRVEARSSLPLASGPVARQVTFGVFPPEPPSTAAADTTASVVAVLGGAMSGVRAPREVVVRSEVEWQQLWSALPIKRAAPRVTFDDTMIVAVFLGVRPTAGYSVAIEGARREGDTLVIEYLERAPPDAGNPPTETTPFVIAGVPRHDGPVRFEPIE